ncbi:MAG: penicillin-binding protein activator LpoB [Prevotellaceae bacterium]|jgi:hypothetical protein|nr:penicillin-binding protein activator LpoB [Prevotellaceae bacterium]
MKQILITFLILCCASAAYGQYYSDKEKVAVYVTGGSGSINKTVGNRLVLTIVKQKKYTAVERSTEILAQLQKEYGYQRSGNVDARQISQVGRQLGVDIVCVAEITEVKSVYSITVKLIDVETAEITDMDEAYSDLKTIDNLVKTADKLAAELFGVTYIREYKGFHMAAEGLAPADGKQWGGNLIIGYRFNAHLSLGVGSGYHSYSAENSKGTVIPGFVDFRVHALSYMVSPYFAVAGGVCFDRYTNTDTYVDHTGAAEKNSEHQAVYAYYHASAGLHVRCSDVFALFAGAGYNNMAGAVVIQAGLSVTF